VTDAAVEHLVARITEAAPVVLRVRGLGGRRWVRDVQKGGRIGPWLRAEYEVVDRAAWHRPGACLYLVCASDGHVRYVGISERRFNERWRTSPALDAETKQLLPQPQLFHSQCWKPMEADQVAGEDTRYEVRTILASALAKVLASLGQPWSDLATLDAVAMIAAVEAVVIDHKSADLARWNVARPAGARRRWPGCRRDDRHALRAPVDRAGDGHAAEVDMLLRSATPRPPHWREWAAGQTRPPCSASGPARS